MMETEALISRRQFFKIVVTTVGVAFAPSKHSLEASPGHSTTGSTEKPQCIEIFETGPQPLTKETIQKKTSNIFGLKKTSPYNRETTNTISLECPLPNSETNNK